MKKSVSRLLVSGTALASLSVVTACTGGDGESSAGQVSGRSSGRITGRTGGRLK
ncbi:hypothetical protein [Streptomyces sp. NPDC051219]|uniref:hypothetical protein n=1 Tax=Streptomyces sp. NPDC051219 TaxID=3155283 RepID=UPI0034228E24